MLIVLQRLHYTDLSGHDVSVMFDCETYGLIHAQSDLLGLHIYFRFDDAINWTRYAAEEVECTDRRVKGITHFMKVSLSVLAVHRRMVFSLKTLDIRASVTGIWSIQFHSSVRLLA